MREDIKKRIAIKENNAVLDGYVKNRSGLMPEEWTPIRLAKNIFKNYSNKRHDGTLPVLSASQERGIVLRDEIEIDIKYSRDNINSYKKVESGDFVISLRSFQGGIEYSELAGLVSPAYTVLKPRIPIADGYYKNYFKTNDMISRLNATLYGIRDGKQIRYEDFGELILHYPPIKEQQKIAEILNHCDKVIELKQQFIEEERNRKKWLLQNLFDPDSDVRPIKWLCTWTQSKLLGLCISICDGDWIESKDQSEAGIRLIQTGNIGVNNYIDKGESARYISQNTFDYLNCTEVSNGDVLLSRLPDPIGRACMIENLKEKAITAVDCSILKFHNKITAKYFLQYASTNVYFKQIAILAGGSTRTRISRKEIENLTIPIPDSLDVKEDIVNALSTIDNNITLLEKELAQWQQKKKSLMQLLLTGLVRVTV